MTVVRDVKLPGVGVRHEFTTEQGKYVGVVSHRSGRKELYVVDPREPNVFRGMLSLSERDARTLTDSLGGSRVAEELSELQQRIKGARNRLASDTGGVTVRRPEDGEARIRTTRGIEDVVELLHRG